MIRSNAVVSVAPEASVIAVTSRSVRPNSVTAATPRQPSAGRVDGRSAKASNAASRPSIADTSAFIDAMISAVLDVLYRSSASRYSRRLSPKVLYMLWRLRPMCVSSASVEAPSYPWLANTSIALPRTWSRSNSFGRAMSGWYAFWTDMSRTVNSQHQRPPAAVAAASGAASVRVWHITSRGWDPWTERPLPEVVRVAYPLGRTRVVPYTTARGLRCTLGDSGSERGSSRDEAVPRIPARPDQPPSVARRRACDADAEGVRRAPLPGPACRSAGDTGRDPGGRLAGDSRQS